MAILTVTLNPALDLETRTDALLPGEKMRCRTPTRDPGGGGINVARAVVQLGGAATALVAAGGAGASELTTRLEALGLKTALLPAPGELRQNLSVIADDTGAQYRFIFPGPTWTKAEAQTACRAILEQAGSGDWVVLSGSLPLGWSTETLLNLIKDLSKAGARVVADTSGAALGAIAATPGTGLAVLRMDHEESQHLTGRTLATRAESAEAAGDLVAKGIADAVIMARGAEGSVMATQEGRWFAPAAKVPVRSRTGAGDSSVAGAVLALAAKEDWPEVLSSACAAASAAVTTEGTQLCERATYEALLPESHAIPL